MAGYKGYSMSNNAVEAYAEGEKPLSKWTKKAILEEAREEGLSEEVIKSLSSYPLYELRMISLRKSSWHHTSKMFNETDFYRLRDVEDLKAVKSKRQEEEDGYASGYQKGVSLKQQNATTETKIGTSYPFAGTTFVNFKINGELVYQTYYNGKPTPSVNGLIDGFNGRKK